MLLQLLSRAGDGEWKQRSDELALDENSGAAFQLLADFMHAKRYQRLVDFDNHLEDASKDWFNSTLFS